MKIKLENSYSSDYKKALKQGILGDNEAEIIKNIVERLLKQEPLDPKFKDHPLKGDYRGYRDCHVKPDLVLIYKISDDNLHLVRIGTHRELFKGY